MKTLTVSLADLEGQPHGSHHASTNVTVSARYTSPLVMADGTVIPAAIKSKQLPATGSVSFEVYASNDTAVATASQGFAVVVTAEGKSLRGERAWRVERTVKLLMNTANPVALGSLAEAAPSTQYDAGLVKTINGVAPDANGNIDAGTATVAQASTTVAGKVELATNAEAAAGTDATRAVTPANLKPLLDAKANAADVYTKAQTYTKAEVDTAVAGGTGGTVPNASTTTPGKVELATAAETATGTDAVRAVTPAGVKPLLDARVKVTEAPLSPMRYGAVGDGVADDTAALRNTLNAVNTPAMGGVTGADILIPPGEYRITEPLDFYRFSGAFRGFGRGNSAKYGNPGRATVLRWDGPAGQPMLLLRDYSMVTISDMRFEGNSTAMPSYAIESRWASDYGVGTNAQLLIDRVHIGNFAFAATGPNSTPCAAGIGFTGQNGNNDEWTIRDSVIEGCAVGVDLPNSQSIWGSFQSLAVASASTAGIRAAAGFTAFNVKFDNCAIDMLFTSTGCYNIFGWWSERSALIGQATLTAQVNVYGGKWLLQSPYMSGPFFRHDLLTSGAGLNLHGVEIMNNNLSTHPKLQVRGAGGGPSGSDLRVIGTKTTMTLADYDVTNPSNPDGMRVLIDAGGVYKRRTLTNGQSLDTVQAVEMTQVRIGSVYLRDNGGVLEKSTNGSTWTAV